MLFDPMVLSKICTGNKSNGMIKKNLHFLTIRTEKMRSLECYMMGVSLLVARDQRIPPRFTLCSSCVNYPPILPINGRGNYFLSRWPDRREETRIETDLQHHKHMFRSGLFIHQPSLHLTPLCKANTQYLIYTCL